MNLEMKVNDSLIVKIIDNDNLGNGIAKINEYIIFVKGALINELISIKINKIKKNIVFASIENIIEKSDKRINVKCKYYDVCGGCDFLHTSYENERIIKEKYLKKLFKKDINYIKTYNEYNYRNKVTFHVKDGKIGLYNAESHDICTIDECLIAHNKINEIYNKIKYLNLDNIHEIMIRCINNELMLNIKCNKCNIEQFKKLNVSSLYINSKYIKGKKYLIDNFDGIFYSIYPESFYQVNDEGKRCIYNKAREYLEEGDKLLDLYCGTGTIGMFMHDRFKEIEGYEINYSSVENAKLNMKLNNITNYNIFLKDASKAKGTYDKVVVDPPRSGLSKKVITYLNKNSFNKIVYISCNPNTLRRDIDLLYNYEVKEISACDMFPRTHHVEIVCVLERR